MTPPLPAERGQRLRISIFVRLPLRERCGDVPAQSKEFCQKSYDDSPYDWDLPDVNELLNRLRL